MEIILNRLRGSGNIVFGHSGSILQGLYYFGLVWALSNVWIGLGALALFILGESYAWGKWLGVVCYPNNILVQRYKNDKDGESFPFVNFALRPFLKEETKKDIYRFSVAALAYRGFWWWAPMSIYFYFFGLMSLPLMIASIVVTSLGFPLAAYLSTKFDFEFKYGKLECTGNWERQEFIYGLFQFIGMTLLLLLNTVI